MDLWPTTLSPQPSTTSSGMASGDDLPPTCNNDQPASGSNGLSMASSAGERYATPYDWQITKTTVNERGRHLLETGQWSDCKFIVGTEPHQQVCSYYNIMSLNPFPKVVLYA